MTLVLVLERLAATLFKLYLFGWPEPVYFSRATVILFLGHSAAMIALGTWIAHKAAGESPWIHSATRWAICVNGGGLIIVAMMMSTHLAVLHGES